MSTPTDLTLFRMAHSVGVVASETRTDVALLKRYPLHHDDLGNSGRHRVREGQRP
jgi:hypothetical protein